MRLINADKLIAHLNDFALAVAPPFEDNSWEYKLLRYGYKIIQECMRGVEEQPTVEAIPVEWLEMFMQRYKIEGGNEYKLLHFMVTEWKKWEKENAKID